MAESGQGPDDGETTKKDSTGEGLRSDSDFNLIYVFLHTENG